MASRLSLLITNGPSWVIDVNAHEQPISESSTHGSNLRPPDIVQCLPQIVSLSMGALSGSLWANYVEKWFTGSISCLNFKLLFQTASFWLMAIGERRYLTKVQFAFMQLNNSRSSMYIILEKQSKMDWHHESLIIPPTYLLTFLVFLVLCGMKERADKCMQCMLLLASSEIFNTLIFAKSWATLSARTFR